MKIIITEDQFNLIKKNRFISDIKEYGFQEISGFVGGNKNLLRLLEINTPKEFLNIYNDLDVVQSKEQENVTLFRYKKGYNLMYYNRKNRYIDINNNDIWSVLINTFELTYGDVQALIKAWLETTYNLKGTTPVQQRFRRFVRLETTYNLKGTTPSADFSSAELMVETTYNLKGTTPNYRQNFVQDRWRLHTI